LCPPPTIQGCNGPGCREEKRLEQVLLGQPVSEKTPGDGDRAIERCYVTEQALTSSIWAQAEQGKKGELHSKGNARYTCPECGS